MGSYRIGFVLLIVPVCLALSLEQSKKTPPKDEPYLGIAIKGADLVLDGQSKKLLEIVFIFSGPLKSKGLKRGDLIMTTDGQTYSDPDHFRSHLLKKKPGDKVTLRVIRRQLNSKGKRTFLEFTRKVVLGRKRDFAATLGQKGITPFNPNHKIRSRIEDEHLPIEIFLRETIKANRLDVVWRDLQNSMVEDEMMWPDPFKIDPVSLCRMDPLKGPALKGVLIDGVQPVLEEDFSKLMTSLGKTLGIPLDGKPEVDQRVTKRSSFKESDTEPILSQLFRRLKTSMSIASEARSLAFKEISHEDRAFLWKQIPKLLTDLKAHLYLDKNEDEERFKEHHRLLSLATRIDFRAVLQMGDAFSWLLNRDFLASLVKDLEEAPQEFSRIGGLEGTIISMESTPWGPIIIGGAGGNIYECRRIRAAAIIDLGGDDLYLGPCGSSLDEQSPFGVVLDLSGTDRYDVGLSGQACSQGCGLFGVGVLIDREGMDTYLASDLAQGASFMGIGILWDVSGDDRYEGDGYLQGSGAYGLSSLIDQEGDDKYRSRIFSQGFGLTGGLGVLIDRKGNDRYTATGDAFETKQAGFSQGMGVGFRRLSPGGMGILFDMEGQDIYQARDFSQGGGYFFGLGLLFDGGGNDRYLSNHYGQGHAAHSAVGILVDREGDDIYRCKSGACQGGAWDKSVGWLVDEGGRDGFDCDGMGQGAAAHRSFATLINFGEGRFSGKGKSLQGFGGKDDNPWPARSLGILIQIGESPGFFSTWDAGVDAEKDILGVQSRIREKGGSGYGITTLAPRLEPGLLRSLP
jgi:hypothetical protein